jgi:hypothetical protein
MIMPPGFEGMPGGGEMMGGPGMEGPGPNGGSGGLLGGMFDGSGTRRVWGGAEFLYWVPASMRLTFPTVTTSSALDLGTVGRTTTASIGPGPQDITFDAAAGMRAIAGFVIDESGQFGVEGSGFWLEPAKRNYSFNANSVGQPILAVPFVDATTGNQSSYVVAAPGINTGSINIDVTSRVWGLEANGIYNLYQSEEGPGGLTVLAGPRYIQLREEINYNTTSATLIPVTPPPGVIPGASLTSYFPAGGGIFAGAGLAGVPAPWVITTSDRIRTQNDFYGGQVGFRGEMGYGGAFMSITGKVGAGYMRSRVDLEGATTFTSAGANFTSTQPGGLFNQAQQLGRHRRDQFAMLGEGGVNVGYQIGTFVRIQAGYSFLFLNPVLRPTSGLSNQLVPAQTPATPLYVGAPGSGALPNREITGHTDFTLHGFNLGVQIGF